MKKLVSIMLVMILILSSIISAGAYDPYPQQLFEDKFVEQHMTGHDGFVDDYMYNEFYYHYDENGQVDWALVSAMSMMVQEWFINQVICDRVLMLNNEHIPFRFGYAVYDVKNDCFVELSDGMLDYYDGLREYWTNKKVGRLIGDADRDGELSVLDATYIQRALAKLCDFGDADIITGYDYSGMIKYISDFDRDGDRSVLDATAIQRRLALLDDNALSTDIVKKENPYYYDIFPEMPEDVTAIEFDYVYTYTDFKDYPSSYFEGRFENDIYAIATSKAQYDKFMNIYNDEFDEELFETKSVVIAIRHIGNLGTMAPITDLSIKDNILYFRANVSYPEPPEVVQPVGAFFVSIVPLDKSVLAGVTDIVRVK